MNIIDVIIILLLVAAIQRGLRLGLLRLTFSAIGFVLGLYIGSLIAGLVGAQIIETNLRILVSIGICLMSALTGATLGEIVGLRLASYAERFHLRKLNNTLGAGFEIVFALLLIWILASPLSNMTSGSVGRSIHNSSIIGSLNSSLPPPPDLLSELGRVISASGLPQVFVGIEPKPQSTIDTASLDTEAVRAAAKSVVKIESYGCGGIIDGSGYVAKPGVVVTNAHVIAGITRPGVIADGKVYRASTVWFDKDTDYAILSVPNLPTPAIPTISGTVPDKSGVVIMGYPGGGPLTISDGAVIDNIEAVGRSIYNRGLVTRQIYEVQGSVEPGNSGGPIVNEKGEAVGLVFAKSVNYDNLGYALVTSEYQDALRQSSTTSQSVSTGRCAAS